MAKLIAWPPSATEYPGVTNVRVHAEVVRDLVFDRSAEKTPFTSMLREGERVPNKQFYHVLDSSETITSPTLFTRAATGDYSDWGRTAVATLGATRGVTFKKRITLDQFTQNFREDVEVHNDNDFFKAFGVAREYAYQVVKKAKRLAIMKEKRGFEDVLYCGTSLETTTLNHELTGSIGDPSITRPLIEQMYLSSETAKFGHSPNCFRAEDLARITNDTAAHAAIFLTIGATTAQKADANLPTVQVRINEDLITRLLETTSGNEQDPEAMPDMLMSSTSPYSHMGGLGSVVSPSGNLGALTLTQSADLEKIKRAVRAYESMLGPVAFARSRWIPQANNLGTANGITKPTTPIYGRTLASSPSGNPGYLWAFQTDMLENRTFRPFMHKGLPEQGDSAIGYLHGEDAVELLHPLSASVVIGINNV